jgi:hypothetical protein
VIGRPAMTRELGEHSSSARTRQAVALVVGCCALVSVGIPIAAARQDHANPPTGGAENQAGAEHGAAQRQGGAGEQRGAEGGGRPGGEYSEQRGAGHGRQGASGGEQQAAGGHEQQGAGHPEPQAAGGHEQQSGGHGQQGAGAQRDTAGYERQGRGARAQQSGGRGQQSGGRGQQSGGAERHGRGEYGQRGASHEQRGAESDAQQSAEGGAHRGGHRATTGAATGPTVAPATPAGASKPSSSGASTPNSAAGSTPSSTAGLTPSSVAGSTPNAATAPAVTPTIAPAAVSAPATSTAARAPASHTHGSRPGRGSHGRHTAHRAGRHGHGRTAGRVPASAGAQPRALASAGSDGAARGRGTHGGAGGKHTQGAARETTASSHSSPITSTITKIVDVVPAPMRILIALLFSLALALGVRTRLAAVQARRLEKQRGELLEDVGLLQAALLPVPPPRLGPVGTSAAYRPADGPAAGGDFYDLFALEDGRLAVILGDVSGHGRQALPHTALVRFTLRAYLEAGLSPRNAVQTAGAVLEHQLGGTFATVVAATYHPRERVLVYACAGHPPPLVLGLRPIAAAIAPVTVCSAPPIGAGMRTGIRQTAVSLRGDAEVCFHTDGLTEARVAGELFGAERLAGTLAELGPETTAAELLERVAQETDARPDDMAACLLRIEGGVGSPGVLTEELELDREHLKGDRIERFLLACGVERGELPELVRAARTASERGGTVVLEVGLGEGPPEVALRRENVARLRPPEAIEPAGVGVSR